MDVANEINQVPEWAAWTTMGNYQERTIQGAPVYAAMVKSLDENIGKVIEKLREKGLYENTLIVFTSDNGGLSTAEGSPTSNLPLRAGKGWLYEGGIRVPFIVKMPGMGQKGITSHTPVSGIDIVPTILSVAGVTDSKPIEMDGVDLSGFAKNTVSSTRPLFWHYPHYSNQGGNPGSAIRLGKYKLIHDFERGTAELYDLEVDFAEQTDIVARHEHLADSLFRILDEWRIRNSAVMMTDPNPEWDNAEPIVR